MNDWLIDWLRFAWFSSYSLPCSTFPIGCNVCLFNWWAITIGAQAVQKEHRGLPGDTIQAGRHGWQDRVLQAHAQVCEMHYFNLIRIPLFHCTQSLHPSFVCVFNFMCKLCILRIYILTDKRRSCWTRAILLLRPSVPSPRKWPPIRVSYLQVLCLCIFSFWLLQVDLCDQH